MEKATETMVLAAFLNRARERVVELQKKVVDQARVIAQLEFENLRLTSELTVKDNSETMDKYGLKEDMKLEKDKEGNWWAMNPTDPGYRAT